MAIIKCPECGGSVSDKAQACIHCGYPLENNIIDNQMLCEIDGKTYDMSDIINLFEIGQPFQAVITLSKKYDFGNKEISPYLIYYYDKFGKFPTKLNSADITWSKKEKDSVSTEILVKYRREEESLKKIIKASSPITCPKCGSTAVSTGQRGYSIISGFWGSGRAKNRCGTCGYSWEPRL